VRQHLPPSAFLIAWVCDGQAFGGGCDGGSLGGISRGHGRDACSHTFVQHANVVVERVVSGRAYREVFALAALVSARQFGLAGGDHTETCSYSLRGRLYPDATTPEGDSSKSCAPIHSAS